MSVNNFYGSIQIADFIIAFKTGDETRKLNPMEKFIGKYCDFPVPGLFTELLFKALSDAVSPEKPIPTFTEASGICARYSQVLNQIWDEFPDADSDEVSSKAKRLCTIPTALHTFVTEFSMGGDWALDFQRAVEYFRETEYPKHIAQLKRLIQENLIKF